MDRMIDSGVNLLNDLGRDFCAHAGSVFVQSSVLIAVLLVLDFLLRKRVRAVVRYSVWMLVFVKLLLPPSFCMPTGIGYHWPRVPVVEPPLVRLAPPGGMAAVSTPVASAKPVGTAVPAIDRENTLVVTSLAVERPHITARGLVFLAWLVGLMILCACLMRRVQYVRRLVGGSVAASNSSQDLLAQCAARLGVKWVPQLRLSDETPGPVVCRLIRPVVLIPTTLPGHVSRDRLRMVLIHELAHVKRGDLWVNFLQTVLLIAYFYHPLLWLANAFVRRLREQAVDETVLAALEAEAESYSTTLIDLAEMAFKRPIVGLRLIGIAESRRALEGRIRHMLTQPKPKTAKVGFWGVLAVVVMALVLLPMARAQRAGEAVVVEEDVRPSSTRGAGDHDITAPKLSALEQGLVGQVLEQVEAVETAYPEQASHWPTGPTLYHVDGRGQVTVWRYQQLWRRSTDCAEDEVGWGSSEQVNAEGMYYLPDGTPLSSRWHYREDGGGMHDIRVKVGRVVEEGQRVPLIQRHNLSRRQDLWSRDRLQRTIQLNDRFGDKPVRILVRVDRPMRLGSWWIGDATTDANHFDDHDQLLVVGPPHEDRGPMLVTVEWASGSTGLSGKIDYARIVAEEGVGFDGIAVGDLQCTAEWIKSKLGAPEEERKTRASGAWLDYRDTYGLDFWLFPDTNSLAEIRFNKGFKGRLRSGISMDSTRADVFQTYGKPLEEETVKDLTKHFDNQTLYKHKGRFGLSESSKIFYKQHGLLFWFEGGKILQMVIHPKQNQTHRSPYGSTPIDTANLKSRMESAVRLSDLAKGLLIYANDHDDKFPEQLADLRGELKVGMAWLLENVTYLGKDISPVTDHPSRVLAYDKTLLEEGAGTNVLYLDAHVVFETPDKLEELGIHPAPQPEK